MVLGAILLRLTPHLPNFTPVSAIAIFSGVYLKKRYALLLSLLSLVISDYLLLYINPFADPVIDITHIYPVTALVHSTTGYVWGSILISGLIGLWLRKHQKPSNIIAATLIASFQFFIITNFGVWATSGMYSHDLNGLVQCYLLGIPFFRYTLLGDLFYTGMFFVIYYLSNKSQQKAVLIES